MMNKFEWVMLKYISCIHPQDEREMRLVSEICARPVVYVLIALFLSGLTSAIYDMINQQISAGTFLLFVMSIGLALYLDIKFKQHHLRRILVYTKQEEQRWKRKFLVRTLIESIIFISLIIFIQIYLPLLISGSSSVTFEHMGVFYIVGFAVVWLFSYGKKVELIKHEDNI